MEKEKNIKVRKYQVLIFNIMLNYNYNFFIFEKLKIHNLQVLYNYY